MYSIIKIWAVLLLHQGLSNAHTIHLGEKCADVEPMPYFDINKFTGVWYAIEKTSTASLCLVYNITATDYRKVYQLTQISENPILGWVKDHMYRYQGRLELSDETQSGQMQVKYPLNFVGAASFIVFDTDYKTYAAVYSCQKIGFTHRHAAVILSRTPNLDKAIIQKIHERLIRDQVNPFELSPISHANCNYNTNFTIEVNEHTFSKDHLKKVAKDAAHAVAEGVDFVIKGAKKLYHYVKKDPQELENEKLKEYLMKREEIDRQRNAFEFPEAEGDFDVENHNVH